MSSLPVSRKKENSCDAGNTLEPAGNQGGWGCCSLGLSSSNVSTVFPQEGRVATVARRVLVSIDLDTNQPVSSRWRSKSE